ncbi:hypothetical protein BDK51DRAFT_40579 [Blyttiomyces helicus]|uniref:Uncharacterized protein n=1 Tax=Blyttiomyces helicus TaxID=388810 RepID=A0A4V1IPH5_9FUNG|nr:hypothetical protein BDK51DRAFT_40579 [Blyttiomyces helicus]|eukprot:RKO83077.1 hypothetical protein BDK51DRAFT_40579 [Blyttiomyces helicus]
MSKITKFTIPLTRTSSTILELPLPPKKPVGDRIRWRDLDRRHLPSGRLHDIDKEFCGLLGEVVALVPVPILTQCYKRGDRGLTGGVKDVHGGRVVPQRRSRRVAKHSDVQSEGRGETSASLPRIPMCLQRIVPDARTAVAAAVRAASMPKQRRAELLILRGELKEQMPELVELRGRGQHSAIEVAFNGLEEEEEGELADLVMHVRHITPPARAIQDALADANTIAGEELRELPSQRLLLPLGGLVHANQHHWHHQMDVLITPKRQETSDWDLVRSRVNAGVSLVLDPRVGGKLITPNDLMGGGVKILTMHLGVRLGRELKQFEQRLPAKRSEVLRQLKIRRGAVDDREGSKPPLIDSLVLAVAVSAALLPCNPTTLSKPTTPHPRLGSPYKHNAVCPNRNSIPHHFLPQTQLLLQRIVPENDGFPNERRTKLEVFMRELTQGPPELVYLRRGAEDATAEVARSRIEQREPRELDHIARHGRGRSAPLHDAHDRGPIEVSEDFSEFGRSLRRRWRLRGTAWGRR